MNERLFILAIAVLVTAPVMASNIVVCRVGMGTAMPSSAADAVVLEEHAADGSLARTIMLPSTVTTNGNRALTLAGSAALEGALALSEDGRYITLAGYNAYPGMTLVASTPSSNTNRVVARVDYQGNVDTTTVLNTAFSASSVRGAVTSDGNGFWVSGSGGTGATGGVWYLTLGATGGTQILSTPQNMRSVNVFSGQLYGDSGAASFTNAFSIGVGLPTAAGQTATPFPGMPTTLAAPVSFLLFDSSSVVPGIDTLYVADNRAIGSGGGIQKWTFDGTTWTLATTFTNGFSSGVVGLAGEAAGANTVLYTTTTESSSNNLLRLVDDGSPTPLASVIATAGTNTVYRGVALAWIAGDLIFRNGFETP